jgi:cytochrome c peroxidase
VSPTSPDPRLAFAFALLSVAACSDGPAPGSTPARDARADAALDTDAGLATDADTVDAAALDVPPQLDDATLEALLTLRYDATAEPADPSNAYALLPEARALGQRLYFDPALSGRLLSSDHDGTSPTLGIAGEAGRVSCASCHVPAAGFFDTRSPHQQISLGSQWTRRRSPTLLESAFLPLFNWDGRHDTLWSQAIGVMESPAEFNSGRLFVAQQMFALHRTEYEAVFGPMPPLDDGARFPALGPLLAGCEEGPAETAACHGKPGDAAEYDALSAPDQEAVTRVMVNTAKAIAAYVGALRCGEAPFDRWLDGDDEALTPGEQRGAALFVGQADCARCHSGPRLTDGAFHNVGLRPATVAVAFTNDGDRGAAEGLPLALTDPLESSGPFSDGARDTLPAEVEAAHEGAFRTPTLRCVGLAPSFMHTGQLRTLEQVVAFFDMGGHPPFGYPGTNELEPLGLSAQQQADLVGFLRSLTGAGPAAQLLVAP